MLLFLEAVRAWRRPERIARALIRMGVIRRPRGLCHVARKSRRASLLSLRKPSRVRLCGGLDDLEGRLPRGYAKWGAKGPETRNPYRTKPHETALAQPVRRLAARVFARPDGTKVGPVGKADAHASGPVSRGASLKARRLEIAPGSAGVIPRVIHGIGRRFAPSFRCSGGATGLCSAAPCSLLLARRFPARDEVST